MEKYIKPEIEVIKLEAMDIIMASLVVDKGETDFTNPETDLEWNSINLED